ncbi:MAG: prepilin-type N-terminal cleavage/methylation domain-containing protein [Lachnospiraceae bacterium]|nr:prepilin-type N-terminal cleavage/methylation domain-containing protein [Lachnospiraceae bacterium]
MNKKMNNKGFSLVELIIVIAIMVVLIAVLAPQYLKYVEKSRVASDQTTIVEYIDAMQVLAADPDVTLDSSKSYTLTNSGKTLSVSADLEALFTAEKIMDAAQAKGTTLQSTAYAGATVNIELTYESNMWVVKNASGATGSVEVSGKIK